MPENLLRIAAAEWSAALEDLRVAAHGTVVVVGEEAEGVAEALQRIGTPWMLAQADGFALLGSEDGGALAATGRVADLPAGSVDLVVAIRAWDSVPGMLRALAEAGRVLAAGGVVLAGDLDFDRLSTARPDRYLASALYRASAAATAAMAPRFVGMLDLAIGVNRAGFRDPSALSMDRSVGRYPAADLPAAATRWRGFDRLSADEAAMARSALAESVADGDAQRIVVEREPWNLVAGRKPAAAGTTV